MKHRKAKSRYGLYYCDHQVTSPNKNKMQSTCRKIIKVKTLDLEISI